MAVLVLAPVFKEVEDREDLALGVLLQVAVNGDIAPVANFLGEIGGVKDELRFEEGVGLIGGEEAQVELEPEIAHRLVEKACVACLIPGHVGEALSKQGVFVLDAAAQFLVEQEARKLRRAALLEELDKDLAGFGIKLIGGAVKFFVPDEVVPVVILAELLADGFELNLIGAQIHRRHGVEICGVEARGKDRVPSRILGRRCVGGSDCP